MNSQSFNFIELHSFSHTLDMDSILSQIFIRRYDTKSTLSQASGATSLSQLTGQSGLSVTRIKLLV